MKVNLPVTDTEVQLADDERLISRTDLRGVITYANEAFVRTSGFSETELIGQSHNIVRHPDMPPAAFADLWETLKAGKPWSGMVKNRCKNGAYYWVMACVTPLRENGQVVGYLSVRSRPTRQQIDEAVAHYRKVKDGKASFRPRASLLRRLSDQPLGVRLYSLVGFMLTVLIAFGAGALALNSYFDRSLQRVYQSHAIAVQNVERILMLMGDNRAQLLLAMQHSPDSAFAKLHDHPMELHTDIVVQNRDEITRIWEEYRTRMTPEMAPLAQAYEEARTRFVQDGLMAVRDLLLDGSYYAANQRLLTHVNPLYAAARQHAEALVTAHRAAAESIFAETERATALAQNTIFASIALVLLLAIALSRMIVRSVVRPLQQANHVFERIAEGHYDNPITVGADDETGRVLNGLQSMQIKLGFDVSEARRIAAEALRIKVALDCVDTNVRIADASGRVLYANHALERTIRKLESDIAKTVPGFAATNFVGSDITRFYADPEAARQRLAGLSQTARSMLTIGGREFEIVTSPIVNERGERLGSVGEWRDRTDELVAQRAVQKVVSAAAQGDFSARLEDSAASEFLHELAVNINRLLEAADGGLREANTVLGALADGDLTRRIKGDYQGAFGELKEYTNRTVESLTSMIGQIAEAAASVSTAAQQIAKGNQDLSARTEEQASSLEQTAASMEELTSTVRQNAENAQQARQMAVQTSEVAGKGAHAMQEMVRTMDDIHQAARKIVDIISVIDGIAFQTNILALNAAVEAARAGEQGRGFAVVAGEVRNLAQRSAAAAKEIKALISDSVDKVEQGSTLAGETGRVITDVVGSVKRVTDVVSEISAASAEQSTGIEQVNTAIVHMDDVTQQNAALVEEASAAAESLEEQSSALAQAVSVFRIDVQKHEAIAPPAQSAARLPARPVRESSGSRRAVAARGALPPVRPDDDDEWRDF